MRTRSHITCTLTTLVAVALLALAALAAGCGSSAEQGSASPSPGGTSAVTEQQVIDLVDLTCAAIEKDAAGTFAAIRRAGHGSRYRCGFGAARPARFCWAGPGSEPEACS